MADTSAMSSEWLDSEHPMGGYASSMPFFPRVHPTASIGAPGEDPRRDVNDCPNLGVEMHPSVTVREYVTVHGGFEVPTRIGAGSYLMTKSHVGHDCRLSDRVTVCSGAILGGHTIVHEGATVGLGAITHPKVTIGAYAYVGAGAVVVRDVPPFATVVGSPARVIGVNVRGMERAGMDAALIREVEAHGAERTRWGADFDRDKARHK